MAMQSGFIKRIRDIMRMDAGINGDAQRIEQMVRDLQKISICCMYLSILIKMQWKQKMYKQ